MSAKQLCNSLTKFSKSGSVEDFRALHPLLRERMSSQFSVDVSLRVALKVSERCIEQKESLWDSNTWLCLSFFLRGTTYAHAEAFLNAFLQRAVGRRAFDLSRLCFASGGSESHTNVETYLYGHVIQFLVYALWHESSIVNVFRLASETYRAAFAFVVSNCTKLPDWVCSLLAWLFRSVVSGRSADYQGSSGYEEAIDQAVKECIVSGGMPALSVTFWTACDRLTPTVFPPIIGNLKQSCTTLFHLLARMDHFSMAVDDALYNWCSTESFIKVRMVAGFYALFKASVTSPRMLLRAKQDGLCALATAFVELLRGLRAPSAAIERVLKFPNSGSDSSPLEESWLFMCLNADRRLGAAKMLDRSLPQLLRCIGDIPWAVETVGAFVAQATAKQFIRPATTCAFPGCCDASTALCSLRKCGRCGAAYYCGAHHQHTHWSQHRQNCTRSLPAGHAVHSTTGSEPAIKPEYFCAFPGCEVASTVLHPIDRCGRCLSVRYCGRAHQLAHWPAHKNKCGNPECGGTATDVPPTPPSSAELCAFPGCQVASTVLRPLDRCGRCLSVRYCGRAHQVAHWPTHQLSCVTSAAPVVPRSASDAQGEVASRSLMRSR
jgi:hypothetical protein